MSDKKKNDPSITSIAYDIMKPRWDRVNAVLGGTETMRAAGQTYLPAHSREKQEAYQERLSKAVLYNVTQLTRESWVGRPFSDPIGLSDDMAKAIVTLVEDVDLQGNNLDVFCRDWFSDGLAKAFSHVLVEMPRLEAKEDGKARTLKDDREEGNRPYWIHIPPENIIYMESQVIDGVEVLTHVRILEEVVLRDQFQQFITQQVRILEPGKVQIWEEIQIGRTKKTEWRMKEEFETGLDFIPLVTFYSDYQNTQLGKPPLIDLVDLNISHWQKTSDHDSVLTVARFPMLAASGGNEEDVDKVAIGPKKMLWMKDPTGKFYYVEHTGKAIAASQEDIDKLESRMSQYGAEFLKKRKTNSTATARALDSAEATSPLQDVTQRFMDSVDLALQYTAAWLNLKPEEAGTVTITTDFGPEDSDQGDLTSLDNARERRDISRRTYLEELKRRGILADEYDIDADKELLEEEAAEGLEQMAKMNLDPDNPNPDPDPNPKE